MLLLFPQFFQKLASIIKSWDCEVMYCTMQNTNPNTELFTKRQILDLSKLKAIADDKINVIKKLKFILGWLENIMGEGENAGTQHFLIFLRCFPKASFAVSLKVRIVW